MQSSLPVRICIFIDGRDEYDGDHHAVLSVIQALLNQQHVKICLSNRPYLAFEEAFSGLPRVNLHDLNFRSVRSYAHDQLLKAIEQRFPLWSALTASINELLDSIVTRADGVFLWVVIAVRTLRDGLLDMAYLAELKKVIYSLPEGIEHLYAQIVERIKPANKRETARFLQIILYSIKESGRHAIILGELYFIV